MDTGPKENKAIEGPAEVQTGKSEGGLNRAARRLHRRQALTAFKREHGRGKAKQLRKALKEGKVRLKVE